MSIELDGLHAAPVNVVHTECSRKDVIRLGPGDELEYWVKATDYEGVCPMYCHNVVHEAKGMTLLLRVVKSAQDCDDYAAP